MVIVAIGDSITAGQYLKPGERPWPLLLLGYDISPAGVSDDTTRLGLERFPDDVQRLRPAAVIIQFGHNDCNRWATDLGLPRVSVWAYEANLVEMIERCWVFGADPFLCTLIPTHKNPQHSEDVAHYDGVLRKVANETQTTLIDVRAEWEDGLFLSDGVHPNRDGHRRYAKVVQAALDEWRA